MTDQERFAQLKKIVKLRRLVDSSPKRERFFSMQPLFLVAVAFACGILLVKLGDTAGNSRPPTWLLIASGLLLLASAALLRYRLWLAAAATMLSFALLGAAAYSLSGSDAPSDPAAGFPDNASAEITAHITRASLPIALPRSAGWGKKKSPPEERQVVDVETEQVAIEDQPAHAMELGIRLALYQKLVAAEEGDEPADGPPTRELHYGERIHFTATLRAPRNYGNPGAWDYRGYLLAQGINATAYADANRIELLPGNSGTALGRWRASAQRSIVEHMVGLEGAAVGGPLQRFFTLDHTDAGLLAAMVIGEQALLRRSSKLAFQRTGSYHVLVVSGMNVAILAYVIFWLARRLSMSNFAATVLTIALSAFYAYMTDMGAPIQRAVWMAAIYLVARLLYREGATLNGLGAAALGILIFEPAELFDPSFQLTFLSVVAIMGVASPLFERTSGKLRQALRNFSSVGYDAKLAPAQAQIRVELRMVLDRIGLFVPRRIVQAAAIVGMRAGLFVFDLVALATFMQIAMALPMVVYFHRESLSALPANIVVVPLVSALMPIAIAATALSYVSAWVAWPFRAATALLMNAISGTITLLSQQRHWELRAADPPLVASLLCVAAFIFAMWAAKRRPVLAATSLALLAVSAALLLRPPQPQILADQLEVTAIDVGQGDALLVVTPEGKTVLIDAGGTLGPSRSEFDTGEDVVSPYLWARGIAHLDAVALTHGHGDHAGGLPAVIANFQPQELWIGPEAPAKVTDKVLAAASEWHAQVVHRAAPDAFDFGGAHFEVLAPAANIQFDPKKRNDESLVMRVSYGEGSALLEGDAEKLAEARLLASGVPLHAEVLKVAHHGSANSTQPEFLAAVAPKEAVVSDGLHNVYGHPKPQVLARLSEAHVATYRTDTEGAVTFLIGKRGEITTRWGPSQSSLPPR